MNRRRRLFSIVRWFAILVVVAAVGERVVERYFPFPLERLTAAPRSLVVLANDGEELRITAPDGVRCLPVPLAEYSPDLVAAVIASEDARFREHGGVDLAAVVRAAWSNLCAGRVVSGASTITLQLVRIAEPRPRHFGSKLVEVFRARQLERRLDKDRLLELYLALAPLGSGVAGFEAAARRFYGKSARALGLDEAATLAALLPAPTRRASLAGMDELTAARNRVLRRLADAGVVSAATADTVAAAPARLGRFAWPFGAPHACDRALAAAARQPPRDGVIRTAIDGRLQRELEALVEAAPRVADGIAVVVLERASGEVVASIGGYDWRHSKVDAANRRRDVGSTLKPFLYALGISTGAVGSESVLADAPAKHGDFAPRNFDSQYRGSVRLRDALVDSLNVPAVGLLERIGLESFRRGLRGLGLELPRNATLDAALGTVAFSPLSLAEAWRRFADRSRDVAEMTVRARFEILAILAEGHPLPGGVDDGAVAWKTGTSSGRRDAWTVGVTARHSVAVWLGNLDGRRDDRLVGARVAAPLFARIVAALERRNRN